MISLIPGLRHGHPPGWNAPDGYAFAESIVRTGRPWGGQVAAREEDGRAIVEFRSELPLEQAVLVRTNADKAKLPRIIPTKFKNVPRS